MLGVISTLGSNTGTSRGVGVRVGLGVRDGEGVEVADRDGAMVPVCDVNGVVVHVGVGDGGFVVWVIVTLGVITVGHFSVAAPRQADPPRQMINRQMIAECFILLILPCQNVDDTISFRI